MKRMHDYFGGNDETLDYMENAISLITGDTFINSPVMHIRGLSDDDVRILGELSLSYIDNPRSTIRSFKIMQKNRGLERFIEKRNVTESEIIAFDRIFSSDVWAKMKELSMYSSEWEIDAIQSLMEEGKKSRDIIKTMKDYIKFNKGRSFTEYVNDIELSVGNSDDMAGTGKETQRNKLFNIFKKRQEK